jgi:hypothetical protein
MTRALLAALAALVLAGAALADPLDPKVKLVDADQARAKAALLTGSDLGLGWTGGALKTPSSLKQPICPQLRPNFSKLTITGHAESVFDNGNGGVQVSSDVEVWKTEKQAARHMNALLKPALPTCIRYSLLKTVGGIQKAVLLKTQKRNLGKLAGDSAVSFRVPVGYKVGKQTVVVASDFLLLRKGRTEIYVNVTGPSNDAALTALEKRIAKTLLGRVRA